MISIKINTKNSQPRAKNAKNQLFESSTHPRAETKKNMFFVKILSFFEKSHKNSILRAYFEFFFSFFIKIKRKSCVCWGTKTFRNIWNITICSTNTHVEVQSFNKNCDCDWYTTELCDLVEFNEFLRCRASVSFGWFQRILRLWGRC